MKFFQSEEQNRFTFKCLHLSQLMPKCATKGTQNRKKPFQRYRDMRLAIKLVDRQDIYLGNSTPRERKTDENIAPLSFFTTTGKNFSSKRKDITFKQGSSLKYRHRLVKTAAIDRIVNRN